MVKTRVVSVAQEKASQSRGGSAMSRAQEANETGGAWHTTVWKLDFKCKASLFALCRVNQRRIIVEVGKVTVGVQARDEMLWTLAVVVQRKIQDSHMKFKEIKISGA